MVNNIQFGFFTHYKDLAYTTLVNISQNATIKRIGEIVSSIFSKLSSYFSSFNTQSDEMNLKPIALISVICLITLMVISIFRSRDDTKIIPPSPSLT